MLIKVIGESEYVITSITGAQIKVKTGEVFDTHPMYGNSYLVNYPHLFKEHLGFEVPQLVSESVVDDVELQKQKAVEIRDQIKAFGKNPIVGNDITKLQAQLDKLVAEQAEATAKAEAEAKAVETAPVETTTVEPTTTAPATVETTTESVEETKVEATTADATAETTTTITQ